MYKTFKRAICHTPPEDIVLSSTPPFKGFCIPPILHTFYRHLEEQQAGCDQPITGGFVFGGMFASIQRGERPNDYDVYVGSPKLIENLSRNMSAPVNSYREMEERNERKIEILGYDFPLTVSDGAIDIIQNNMFGRYISIKGLYGDGDETALFDLKIGERDLPVEECARFMGAPITTVGATLGGTGAPFAYHRDYAEHALAKILCHPNPTSSLLDKAKTKGWAVITPEQRARGSYSGEQQQVAGTAPAAQMQG